jgi:two-component system, cell cycle sensor histidine kinase and response regulator CckA
MSSIEPRRENKKEIGLEKGALPMILPPVLRPGRFKRVIDYTSPGPKSWRSFAVRYGLAVATTAATLLIAGLLQRNSLSINLTILVVAAVLIPAWYGGLGPGMLVAISFELVSIVSRPPAPDASLGNYVFGHASTTAFYTLLVLLASGRRKAEKNIKDQREWLKVTLSSINDGVIATDTAGLITFINPIAEDLTGWTAQEAIGNELGKVFTIIDETTGQRTDDRVARALWDASNDSVSHQATLVNKAGKEIKIDDRRAPIRESDGTIIGMVSVFHDISERIHLEESRRLSEERYRTLFDYAPDGILIADPKSYYLDANESICRMLGYPCDELIGLHATDIVLESEFEYIDPALDVINAKSEYHREWRFKRKDGTNFVGDVIATAMPDGNILAVIRDITERKEEVAVRESLASIVESSDDAIIAKDLNGIVTTWNSGAERIYGYSRGEMIGAPLLRLIPPDRVEEENRIIARVVEGQIIDHFETIRIRKDGKPIDVSMSVSPLKDAYGKVIGASKIARDITDRKRAEHERRVMSEIIDEAITTPNLEEYLKLVHRSISQILYAENCFVMLHDPATNIIDFEFWVDRRDPRPEPKPRGRGFASYVLRTGVPLLLTKEAKQELQEQGEAEQIGSTSASWMGVPLRTPSRTIGVLVLQHYEKDDEYSKQDLAFLTSVGDQIALAIERKRAVEALIDSEERYRLLFEKNPLPMWVYDLQTLGFLEVNDAAVHHYGYTRAEFRSMTILDIRPSEDVAPVLTSVENEPTDIQSGRAWRHRKKDGTIIDVEITSHALSFLDHSARLVLAKDITETKRAEEALSESEERNRDLVENAIDIIYTHDLEGNYTSVNKAGEKITGYTMEEALTMNLTDVVAPEYREFAMGKLAAKFAGEQVGPYEIEILAKDGSRVAVEINTRILFEKGEPVGVQGIARDVTQRKQLEEQFLQAQKMESIGVLAGGIAHDFNNLLTAINGYSELTLKKMSGDDPLRRNIQEVKEAGDRATALTGQLLAFSRKKILQPKVHNLNPLISNLERMLRRIIRENIELRTVLDPELGNINADPGQMEQVLMNLTINARDAMPNGGTLTIETQNVFLDEEYVSQHIEITAGPFVKLVVTDSGQGMDEETRRRIFEPFFTTKEVGKGTGLGLSTVYGIVKQSGGDIMVYSEIGHGTTFKIYLPSIDETVQRPKWIDEGEDSSGTETILVVEDEEIVRNLVSAILEGLGYKVLEAGNGEAALSICKNYTGPIHLLLSDVIMPNMSGSELRENIVKVCPDIRVMFMSGYTDDSISNSGILASKTAFIEKPFTPDKLARKVREVLES